MKNVGITFVSFLFNINIYMSTIFILVMASVICFLVSFIRRPFFGMSTQEAAIHALLTLICGLAGVKLLYCFQNFSIPPDFSGMSFFGAVYFVPIGFGIYNKITKTSWIRSLDFVALYGALFLGATRFNCYYSGCCGSFEVYCFGRTVVPPIQLIEAFFDIAIFTFLWWRESKPLREGAAYPLLLTLYGFLRLVMENYRAEEKSLCGMSNGQWNAILCFVTGAILLYCIRNKKLIKRSSITNKKQRK